ncbi:MAG: hypothetical protein HOW73_00175 [Polyangiaceae bacterium]|nr:hypothetical protein [Polyangiaceae bacterium]
MLRNDIVKQCVGSSLRVTAVVAAACAFLGCGGAVKSGVAVGQIGHGVGSASQTAPQGGEVCLMQEAMTSNPQAAEKPMSEACVKAFKSDELWRRSMAVLAAYGGTIEAAAFGMEDGGRLEAARTGITGPDWIAAEGPAETAARDSAHQLVTQMSANPAEEDLEVVIRNAAPHVKAICDGLSPYLEAQAKAFGDLKQEVEKKRTSKADRRCGSVDNKSVCVSDSSVDRVVYANAYGQIAVLESNHVVARDSVAAFCAAHKKLEEAGGDVDSDETYDAVVEAVKAARGASASAPAASGSEEGAPAAPAAPAEKK